MQSFEHRRLVEALDKSGCSGYHIAFVCMVVGGELRCDVNVNEKCAGER